VSGPRQDLAIGGAAAVLGAGAVAAESGNIALAATTAVLGGALALARRRHITARIVAIAALLLSAPAGGEVAVGTEFLVAAHALAAGRWTTGMWTGLAGMAALTGASLVPVAVEGGSAAPFIFIPIVAWVAGWTIRERELVAARLAERARELDSEREAYARLSVRYERARIAAELHDIVAHAISVMVVQASAGQRLAAVDPSLTSEAFGAIGDAARQAEQDMGRLVALLADDDAIGAAPDLALVEELVARAASAGLDVTLRLEGEREGYPVGVVQVAYRVVQEAVTNAMRYAAGSSVAVTVRGEAQALAVEVVNGAARRATELADQGTGNGLRGLRERLSACGGTLDAGPTADGGWHVAARLPRRAAASVA
jgi:signal transduction histidine kinase